MPVFQWAEMSVEWIDSGRHPYERAVVIGGGIAGMLTARVLADYFREVTVIERDWRTAQPAFRRGAPQGQHAHLLLDTGARILERYFPGIRASLLQAGATNLNAGLDIRHIADGIRRPEYASEFSALAISRPVLEWHLAERLRQLPNVDIVQGSAARKLDYTDDRIRGVHLTPGPSRFDRQYLSANLVVDASGRGTTTPATLLDCGFERPRESVLNQDTVYVSRIFRIPSGQRRWKALLAQSGERGASVVPMDRDHWLVTLQGPKGEHPPLDDSGFMQFARDLPVPELHQALDGSEAITDASAMRTMTHVRRHYEDLRRFPEGLLVLGDALCDLPPSQHQGMTIAILQAQMLQDCLEQRTQRRRPIGQLWRDFFRHCSTTIETCWQLATLQNDAKEAHRSDLRWRFMHRYLREIQTAVGRDVKVAEHWVAVIHRIEPLRTLLSARVIGSLVSGSPATAVPVAYEIEDKDTTLIRAQRTGWTR